MSEATMDYHLPFTYDIARAEIELRQRRAEQRRRARSTGSRPTRPDHRP